MEKRKDNIVIRFVKGFVIGASMLVPGASGGTMAIILGIYDELIHAVSTLRQDFKVNAVMLGEYIIAGSLGILILSGPMLRAVTAWNKPMMFFFLGAIIASIPPLYRKVSISKIRTPNILVAAIGAMLGISTRFLPEGIFELSKSFNVINFFILIIAGIVISVALVLPGISASYVLLMMGIYEMTLTAVKEFNMFFLMPLVIGVVFGTLLTARILEREMKQHPQFTYMMIIGFMFGSAVEVFPGIPNGQEVLQSVLTFVVGFVVIYFLGKGHIAKRR